MNTNFITTSLSYSGFIAIQSVFLIAQLYLMGWVVANVCADAKACAVFTKIKRWAQAVLVSATLVSTAVFITILVYMKSITL